MAKKWPEDFVGEIIQGGCKRISAERAQGKLF